MTLQSQSTTGLECDEKSVNFRYERKFVLPSELERDIALLVKLHPSFFSEVYPARFVNNVYFDSQNTDSYLDNIEGNAERLKCRVRWYGDLVGLVAEPRLEFKIKRGLVGTKRQFPLRPFQWDCASDAEAVRNCLTESELPIEIKLFMQSTVPTLLNRYRRKYFESQDRAFRITIDTDLQSRRFGQLANRAPSLAQHQQLIVELKYDRQHELAANDVAQHLGLRVSKNSKYVQGLEYECEY